MRWGEVEEYNDRYSQNMEVHVQRETDVWKVNLIQYSEDMSFNWERNKCLLHKAVYLQRKRFCHKDRQNMSTNFHTWFDSQNVMSCQLLSPWRFLIMGRKSLVQFSQPWAAAHIIGCRKFPSPRTCLSFNSFSDLQNSPFQSFVYYSILFWPLIPSNFSNSNSLRLLFILLSSQLIFNLENSNPLYLAR